MTPIRHHAPSYRDFFKNPKDSAKTILFLAQLGSRIPIPL